MSLRQIRRVIIAILIVLCIAGSGVSAAVDGVRVTTSFDKRTVDLDDEIRMTVKVMGAEGSFPRPDMPEIEGFDAHYLGRSTQFAFVDGESVRSIEFSYALVPKAVGTFPVGPFTIPVKGATFTTEQLSVTVISLSGKKKRERAYKPPHVPSSTDVPFTTSVATEEPVATEKALPKGSDKRLFMRVSADKKTVYPNEQITLVYTIFTVDNVTPEGFEKEPEFFGAWVEDLTEKDDLRRESVYMQGVRYAKAEIKKTAVFPSLPGEYHLNPGTLACSVKVMQASYNPQDPYFDESFFNSSDATQREERLLAVEPIAVTVKPFPDLNKPRLFNAVSGDFRMRVMLDKKSVQINEPLMMRIVFQGTGNVEIITQPELVETEDFVFYTNKTSSQTYKEKGQVAGQKVFEIMYVPHNAGVVSIPAVTFSYFNVKTERYVTLSDGPFAIQVRADATQTGITDQAAVPDELKDDIRIEARDIHFIKKSFRVRANFLRVFKRVLTVCDSVVFVALLLLVGLRKRQEALDKDVVKKRRVVASSRMKETVKRLKKLEKAHDQSFFEESAHALDEYLAGTFNVSAHGLTWHTVHQCLTERGFPDDVVKQCKNFYDICNLARFGATSVSFEQFAETRELFYVLIDEIERHKT